MEHYAGIDVSLEFSSVCAVDPGDSNGPNLPTKSLPTATLIPQSTANIMRRTLDSHRICWEFSGRLAARRGPSPTPVVFVPQTYIDPSHQG